MVLALAWLTISTPFVYADRERSQELAKQINAAEGDEECAIPSTNEEKSESGINTLSEYLHDLHTQDHPFDSIENYYKCHPANLYFSHHPECFSPPPEA